MYINNEERIHTHISQPASNTAHIHLRLDVAYREVYGGGHACRADSPVAARRASKANKKNGAKRPERPPLQSYFSGVALLAGVKLFCMVSSDHGQEQRILALINSFVELTTTTFDKQDEVQQLVNAAHAAWLSDPYATIQESPLARAFTLAVRLVSHPYNPATGDLRSFFYRVMENQGVHEIFEWPAATLESLPGADALAAFAQWLQQNQRALYSTDEPSGADRLYFVVANEQIPTLELVLLKVRSLLEVPVPRPVTHQD